MTNQEIEQRLKKNILLSNRIDVSIIEDLLLMEERKIYIDRYDSINKYCRKELNLTDSEASRRIAAMRFFKKHRETKKDLQEGVYTVSQFAEMKRMENRVKVNLSSFLQQIKNKSVEETKTLIYSKLGLPQVHKIVFEVDEETQKQTRQIRGMFYSLSDIEFLTAMNGAMLRSYEKYGEPRKLEQKGRTTTKSLKKKLMKKANYTCEHPGCTNQMNLQVDHIIPWSQGGKTEESNLRILCQAHNLNRNLE